MRNGVILDGRPDGQSRRVFEDAAQRDLARGRGSTTPLIEHGELCVGHKVNHPPKGTRPTVHALPLDLDEDEHVELHPYLPVVHATLPPAGSGTPWKRTAVLVASRALCDEELWLDYKLCGEAHVLPDWYTPCKPANPEPTNRAMGPDESGDIIIDA